MFQLFATFAIKYGFFENYSSCDPKLPEITNPTTWQWHGNFKYAEMDKSLAVYFACIDKAMEGDCNTQLTAEIRSCVTPSG